MEKPGPFTGLDDVVDEDRTLGSLGDDVGILSDTFDDIEPGGPPPMPRVIEPPELQASTEATQECMRGPCEHHWRMIMRMDAQSDIITIQRVQYCTRHIELMNLHNENTYECDCWWPTPMLMVPQSIRPLLRPLLRRLWDLWLQVRGETFAWRWWPRNVFDLDPDEVHELRQAAVRRRDALEVAGSNGGGNGSVVSHLAPEPYQPYQPQLEPQPSEDVPSEEEIFEAGRLAALALAEAHQEDELEEPFLGIDDTGDGGERR
jgi:hypothetical protein